MFLNYLNSIFLISWKTIYVKHNKISTVEIMTEAVGNCQVQAGTLKGTG